MPSWILIPAYLLKNTVQRWLENPASPLTKLVVPLLFALLTLAVLGFLRGIEVELRKQLNRDDLRSIRTVENVFARDAAMRLSAGLHEGEIWDDFCSRYESFQQVPLQADAGRFERIPVIAYDRPLQGISLEGAVPGEPRPFYLLAAENEREGFADVVLQGHELLAEIRPMPEVLDKYYQTPALLFCPQESIELAMHQGFTHIQVLVPKTDVPVERVVDLLRAHARAEGRRITVNSSVEILGKLDELLDGQRIARLGLGLGIAAVLALVLGSLALLEFRQEAYLMALLRSFGVGRLVLGFHFLLENVVLTILGVLGAAVLFEKYAPGVVALALQQWGDGRSMVVVPKLSEVHFEDLRLLAMAAGVGVILAVLPVFWGLRKRPGLVLS